MGTYLTAGRTGAIITFKHPDGQVRSDYALGSPTEAVLQLLEWYPEPWGVLSISHPQLVYADLHGRNRSKSRSGHAHSVPDPPEPRILARLGQGHRWRG